MRRVWFVALVVFAGLGTATVALASNGPRRGHPCRDASNAARVHATNVNCRTAANAVGVYEGAPTGCVHGSTCGQSGENGIGGAVMFVNCHRRNLGVSCIVYLKNPRGATLNPRVFGVVLPDRYTRGTVSFLMRYDPYGGL